MLSQLMYISCFGWCYCQIISWQILLPCLWQMLLPLDVVDVFTTFTFYIVNIIILADVIDNPYCGRSYCHLFCGRCCTTFILDAISLSCKVADVIANFCGRWKTTFHCYIIGRCYCHGGRWNGHLGWVSFGRCYCLGGWWNCHWSAYFNFSYEMFNRTSSHMCGRWNLPTFLFRDGLLALM